MVIEVKLLQKEKADRPILRTDDGITKDVKLVQWKKQSAPIDVTDEGIVTDDKS